jgi:hypothetical protein
VYLGARPFLGGNDSSRIRSVKLQSTVELCRTYVVKMCVPGNSPNTSYHGKAAHLLALAEAMFTFLASIESPPTGTKHGWRQQAKELAPRFSMLTLTCLPDAPIPMKALIQLAPTTTSCLPYILKSPLHHYDESSQTYLMPARRPIHKACNGRRRVVFIFLTSA